MSLTERIAAVRRLRTNRQFLFIVLPYFVSFVCIAVGVIWLFLLPLDEYSRQTYISENALLPGQVHTYFGGSEQNVFRGYKKELEGLLLSDDEGVDGSGNFTPMYVLRNPWSVQVVLIRVSSISQKVQSILRANGLKVATQYYEYTPSGITHSGQNVYAVIRAPRGDATEAIVLVAPWRTAGEESNIHGVALALTLARYFKSKLVQI